MKHTTIAIIGMGNVGATTAYTLMLTGLASELLLVDIDQEKCEGEVRDLRDVMGFSATSQISATTLTQARTADIIIICAGKAQKPGQSRRELAQINSAIIAEIIKELNPRPETILLMVTNPVDLMTLIACKRSSLPHTKIIGSGTWLDTQRLKRYLGEHCGVAPESVSTLILGEHGDAQCVAWSQTSIGSQPLSYWNISEKTAHELAHQTTQEAYAIIQAKCATYYGVASCIADVCKAIIYNEQRIIPVSCYDSERDLCYSMPCIMGEQGIEQRLQPQLTPQEHQCLEQSLQTLITLKHETLL